MHNFINKIKNNIKNDYYVGKDISGKLLPTTPTFADISEKVEGSGSGFTAL